jgi:hypothetical protein
MKTRLLAALILSFAAGFAYTITGCGDDEDGQGTCEAGCERILSCADEFGIDPGDFSVQACITDCRAEDPEDIACAGGCDAAPNCVAYAACLGGCGVNFDED